MNEAALGHLDVKPEITGVESGVRLALIPGGRAGAVPLRSAQTGHVVGGFLVEPRFGWSGVGRVLSQTGWHAAPIFLEGPLVPGSGREVPPWVLAGPLLARLEELLGALRRGYETRESMVRQPRGRVVWNRYITESLAGGRWAQIPCRYPDLTTDPILRRITRWALDRLRRDLALAGGTDLIACVLLTLADDLLRQVGDVSPLQPSRHELDRIGTGNVLGTALSRGLEALGWISDERGLGGGRERDGLAWTLSLAELWEQYVEALVRREAVMTGGLVRVARRRETHFPLEWSDPAHRSLGHLAPDIVVTRGNVVHVIDAKYKAHLSELDEHGWRHFTDDAREAHRADIHQILAYASLYAADEIHATLMYPLRGATYEVLREQGRDRSRARLFHGARAVHLELRGVPFGAAPAG
jgi:hypothetical protein